LQPEVWHKKVPAPVYHGKKLHWEKEVVTIMMSLFDNEKIMRTYLKDAANTAAYEADRATAERMIKKGKMSLGDIADCVLALSFDELKKIEAKIMQLA